MSSAFNSWAQLDTVVGAVAHASGAALANPPLPILFNKKGAKKLSLQPGYFVVDGSSDQDVKELDYTGFGLSVLYNHLLSERFGYFLLGSITQVRGDITAPGSGSAQIQSSDINSQLYLVGAGLSYTLISSSWLTLPVFAGPALIGGQFKARVVQTDGGSTLDDFDTEASPSQLGVMAGVQLGLHVSKYLTLNPYFILTTALSEDDNCQEFQTTTVRVSGGLFDFSSPACDNAQANSQSQFEFDVFVQSFGVNLLFPAWGLSVNAYAQAGEVPLFEGTQIRLFFVAFSFGTT